MPLSKERNRERMRRIRAGVQPACNPDVEPVVQPITPVKTIVQPKPFVQPIKPLFDGSINERLARNNRIKYGGKNARKK